MTPDTRTRMQIDDSRDTPEVVRLKRLWWDVQNTMRPYPLLHDDGGDTLCDTLEALTVVLTQDARNRGITPANQILPREPLPSAFPRGTGLAHD